MGNPAGRNVLSPDCNVYRSPILLRQHVHCHSFTIFCRRGERPICPTPLSALPCTLHGSRCSLAAAPFPSPPLEERGRERRSSFSASPPDLLVRLPAGSSARTAASRMVMGLLSPTLSSKGGEGEPLARCSHTPDACVAQSFAAAMQSDFINGRAGGRERPSLSLTFHRGHSAKSPIVVASSLLPVRKSAPEQRVRRFYFGPVLE